MFAVCLIAGAFAGPGFTSWEQARLLGAAAGALVFLGIFLVERGVRRARPYAVLGSAIGVLAGVLATALARLALGLGDLPRSVALVVGALFIYLGALAGARGIRAFGTGTGKQGMSASTSPKILDTSAIIDGRVVDMVDLGFIGGPFVVPQFVLNELQGIADSTDPLKRARGRRGLGVLERLQGMEGVEVRITDQEFLKIKAVDGKIVALAKATAATVVTNDFNLTKIAELQGVRVLNVNQLANALRPVVLPGEVVQLTLQKPGKEPGQGVGYLEDGTMVVVENGAGKLGEAVKAVVTSVLQTTAGRMIFARSEGEDEGEEEAAGKSRRRVWRRRG